MCNSLCSELLWLCSKEVEVELPGGTLFINITDEGVIMKGPVAYILRGEAYLDVVGD